MLKYMLGDGRKTPKMKEKDETKEKRILPVWLPSHPPVYKIGRPTVFRGERTENKPDLP